MKFPIFRRATRFLSPPSRRFYQRPTETTRATGIGPVEWILARALVHFKSFPLADIPRNQRVAALRMQIKQWNPFASAGSCVVIEHDTAMVWLWDQGRVNSAIADAGLQPGRVKVLPETLLAPQLNNGLRLLKTLDGVEAQVWKSNVLAASRWWPAQPTGEEWEAFQRDAGLAERIPLPGVAQAAPLLAEPWARATSLEAYRSLDSRVERLVYVFGSVLLGAATLWYGIHLVKNSAAASAKRSELTAVNEKAQPVIAARNQSQAALLRVQALLGNDPYPNQLQLMAKIAEVLPKNGTVVREWNFQNGKLKLLVAVPDAAVQSSALVSVLQSAGPFNNVRSIAGGDSKTLVFNMDVNPRDDFAP